MKIYFIGNDSRHLFHYGINPAKKIHEIAGHKTFCNSLVAKSGSSESSRVSAQRANNKVIDSLVKQTNFEDSVVVFIGRTPFFYFAKKIKLDGGKVVWNMMEEGHKPERKIFEVVRREINLGQLDGIVSPSDMARKTFVLSDEVLTRTLYYFVYDNILPQQATTFGVVFCGGETTWRRQQKHIRNNGITSVMWRDGVDTETYLERIRDFPFHISIRNNPHKHNTKFSLAARFRANIITNKTDGAAYELLGPNYPYMCDDPSGAEKMIKYAKDTYLKEPWYKGLEIMKEVNKKTSDVAIVKQYLDFFGELNEN